MTKIEILEELRKLSTKERLEILESTIHLLQEDLQKKEPSQIGKETKRRLAVAAEKLLPDYQQDKELISFTVLDSENFYV